MNPTPTLFDQHFDLSINKVKYSEQDYVRMAKENFELKKENKELRQIIKNYNAISRKKKK